MLLITQDDDSNRVQFEEWNVGGPIPFHISLTEKDFESYLRWRDVKWHMVKNHLFAYDSEIKLMCLDAKTYQERYQIPLIENSYCSSSWFVQDCFFYLLQGDLLTVDLETGHSSVVLNNVSLQKQIWMPTPHMLLSSLECGHLLITTFHDQKRETGRWTRTHDREIRDLIYIPLDERNGEEDVLVKSTDTEGNSYLERVESPEERR